MNLKRLEMIGFKSFADKTVIEFKNGVTGIVGPNGSGKSNIADAIRWVLGEQRSKQLRGSNMKDVIFKGTQERQPLSYCEVSLVFDNAEHIFNTEYNEIAITRKLYRSGESEYLINKNVVRLKDITAILHDVGIGKDGYSIIGQNRVTEIVHSKPIDRRKIFEEAAGIAKFKSSRSESQNKLEKTMENMKITQNLMAEKQSRIDQLIPQSAKTKKFLELKEKLKILEINNYIYQYDNASLMKSKIQTKINAISEESFQKSRELNVVIKKSNENTTAIEKIDNTTSRLYNKKTDLMVAQEKNSGETKLLKERQKIIVSDLDRIGNEINLLTQQLENTKTELKNTKIDVENLKLKNRELNEEITKATAEYSVVLDRLTQSELGSANSQKDMIEALNKLSDTREDLAKLTAECQSLTQQNQDRKNELEELNIKYGQSESTRKELNKNLSQLQEQNRQSKLQEDKLIQKINKDNEKLDCLDRELSENIKVITTIESQYKMLSDLERDYNGYNNGVTSILRASKTNPKIKEHLVGVVANMIDVPQKYRTAIETALGSNVQNLIVESEDDAEMLINFLKNNRYGQATFLPLTTVKPRHINKDDVKMFNIQGCYGVASDLIKYDKKIEKAVKTLLGAIIVCEDTHTAITLAKANNFNFRIVTLDGNQTSTSGAISGGSQRSNISHVLNREKDIENLKNQLITLKKDDENKRQERKLLIVELQESNQNLRKLQNVMQQDNINLAKTEEMLETCIKDIKIYKGQIDLLTNLVSQTSKRLIDINSLIEISKLQEDSLSSNRNVANQSMELTQKQSIELKQEKDKYQDKISNFKVQITQINTKISVGEDNIIRLDGEVSVQSGNLQGLLDAQQNKLQDKQEIEGQIAELQNTKQYIEIESELKKVEKKLGELEEYKRNLQLDSRELEEKRIYLTSALSSLNEKKNQENINITKVDADLESMEKRVWEGYELTYGNCQEFKIEDYDVKKGIVDAQNCRRSMDSLGNINLDAIVELEEEQRKYDEMSEQFNDLDKAKEQMTQIINNLSNEMQTKFLNQFNKINENFGIVFKELFGGGKAKLELKESETDDPLDQGVDIIIEPPGKKFSNISLFSGGEQALTAIAILFAILKLRDMPFILLDEVEAALDEMNVKRFAKYLNRFAKSTQFIVITHRKPTMEQADRLCGVTIQNTVSVVINIKLSDAIKIAEEEKQ